MTGIFEHHFIGGLPNQREARRRRAVGQATKSTQPSTVRSIDIWSKYLTASRRPDRPAPIITWPRTGVQYASNHSPLADCSCQAPVNRPIVVTSPATGWTASRKAHSIEIGIAPIMVKTAKI